MSCTFSVKNFERFQHYKDRSPPWIKLYNSTLEDYAFAKLPDASKAHLFAIWLLASRCDNKLPIDPTWIAQRINATEPVNLSVLFDAGFLVADQPLPNVEQVASKPQASRLPRERVETEGETEQRENDARKRAVDSLGFSRFWDVYPEKVGKGQARKAFPAAVVKAGSVDAILAGVERYKRNKPPDRAWCNPATFLNGERWSDVPASANPTLNGGAVPEQIAPSGPPPALSGIRIQGTVQ